MGRQGRHCIMAAPAIIWRWLAGSKAGRMVALAGGFVLSVALLYQRGRRDAERAAERDALQGYVIPAKQRTTPCGPLMATQGPLTSGWTNTGGSDEQAHGHGGGTAARRGPQSAMRCKAVDTRKTADDALRASDGDARPVDERLDEHGRLR